MEWFYIRNGKRIGPVAEGELFRLARAGLFGAEDLVWNPALGPQWVPATTVPALAGFAAAALAPGLPGATPNRELMRRAWEALRGRWAVAVGAALLFELIMGGSQAFFPHVEDLLLTMLFASINLLVILAIAGPLLLGWYRFFLRIARRESPEPGRLFDGFKTFRRAFAAYALMGLYISLWSLLLIVPGIVAALAYSQTFFILSDHPELSAAEAIARSKRMINGFKLKKFCLGFRFLGWIFLSAFTCFIGLLWVYPYAMASNAHFYEDIRAGG